MMALPYITEHTGFTGTVYATEPTLQIGRCGDLTKFQLLCSENERLKLTEKTRTLFLFFSRLLMEELVNFMERVPKPQSATCWKNKELQR